MRLLLESGHNSKIIFEKFDIVFTVKEGLLLYRVLHIFLELSLEKRPKTYETPYECLEIPFCFINLVKKDIS